MREFPLLTVLAFKDFLKSRVGFDYLNSYCKQHKVSLKEAISDVKSDYNYELFILHDYVTTAQFESDNASEFGFIDNCENEHSYWIHSTMTLVRSAMKYCEFIFFNRNSSYTPIYNKNFSLNHKLHYNLELFNCGNYVKA